MDYTLMNKNTPVLKINMDEGYIISVKEIYNSQYLPVGVSDKPNLIKTNLRDWWTGRSIPASRDKIGEGLINLGIETGRVPAFLLERCFGLSLSDQYWINPVDSPLKWSDINFFENDFSEDIGKALFDNQLVDNPNLMSPDNTSDGWLKKKWKIINGERCLVKAGARPFYQQPFNEAIASAICKSLDIKLSVNYSLNFENSEPVSVCKNFITPDTELVSAHSLMLREKKENHTSYYKLYTELCNERGITDIFDRLDEMIVLDYIIRNEDRHYNNFGLIRNVETLEYVGTAPLFDNGTSLLFDVATEDIVRSCIADSVSKSFRSSQEKQIQLVRCPQRFDLAKLKNIDEVIYEILSKGNIIAENRKTSLCRAVKSRIEKLDRLFAVKEKHTNISSIQQEDKPSVIAQVEAIKITQQKTKTEAKDLLNVSLENPDGLE